MNLVPLPKAGRVEPESGERACGDAMGNPYHPDYRTRAICTILARFAVGFRRPVSGAFV
jgi:hypothetical protein